MHPIRQRLRCFTRTQRILVVAFIFGILAALFWRAIHPAEPSYQGRTATEWLARYDATFSGVNIPALNADHGDRYEAVLAFRAMGDEGLAYLVHAAMPGYKVGWRTRISKLLPDPADRWLQQVTPQSKVGTHFLYPQYLFIQLEPPSASLLPLLTDALKSSDGMIRTTAVSLLQTVRKEDAAAVLPFLLQAMADPDGLIASSARSYLSMLPIVRSKELFPAAVKRLRVNGPGADFALRVVLDRGEEARSAAPLIEPLRQSTNAVAGWLATIALLQLNPERTELLASLTNALGSTNRMMQFLCGSACHTAGPKASFLVPFLKARCSNRNLKSREVGEVTDLLCAVSPPDGVDVMVTRLLESKDPADRLSLACELVRLAPTDSEAQALAVDALETIIAARVGEERAVIPGRLHPGTVPLDYLRPPMFDKPPSAKLLEMLERISKDHEDKATRHTAAQALKYFHLRWPK